MLFVEQAADSIGCVVVKKIDNTIGRLKRLCSCGIVLTHPTEKIPGLGPLIEKLMDGPVDLNGHWLSLLPEV